MDRCLGLSSSDRLSAFIVKVVALGGLEAGVLRRQGNVEGCSRFVWSRSFFFFF